MSMDLSQIVNELPIEVRKLCEDFANINMMMNETRLSFLAASIIAADVTPEDFLVEIGTYQGMTAIFMAKLLGYMGVKNSVVSIDSFERRERGATVKGNYEIYLDNINKYGVADQCFVISAFSHQAAQIFREDIPFILIDGGHYYKAVRSDLDLYMQKLKIGGIAYLDDNIPDIYPGVIQAINEVIIGNKNYEVLTNETYFITRKIG